MTIAKVAPPGYHSVTVLADILDINYWFRKQGWKAGIRYVYAGHGDYQEVFLFPVANDAMLFKLTFGG